MIKIIKKLKIYTKLTPEINTVAVQLPISKIDEGDKDSFKVNQDLELTINQINTENRKIVLSYKLLDSSVQDLGEKEVSKVNDANAESNEITDETPIEEK